MRVTEALLRQNNQKKKKQPEEEKEETQRYMERRLQSWDINRMGSAFDSPLDSGLNTGKSVFDKGAVFHTGRE